MVVLSAISKQSANLMGSPCSAQNLAENSKKIAEISHQADHTLLWYTALGTLKLTMESDASPSFVYIIIEHQQHRQEVNNRNNYEDVGDSGLRQNQSEPVVRG